MALDTVKLRSPPIDEGTASLLERQCLLKQGIQLSTGEVLYEITNICLNYRGQIQSGGRIGETLVLRF